MKRYYTLLLSWALIVSTNACKHESDLTPVAKPETPQHGTIRDKGIPDGQLVQKTIGPEGGTLTSADNRITLTVPAGAVGSATAFSVQPVTNTLPGSPGKSYRLLPEGQTFAKPVTIRFQYNQNDLTNTSAQALFLAYQGADRIWKFLPNTKLDEVSKTLSVESNHFSDWGIFAEMWLEVEKAQLKAGESTKLTIMGPLPIFDATDPNLYDPACEIGDIREWDSTKDVRDWTTTTPSLTIKPSQLEATYTAPAQKPSAPLTVQITVSIYNFLPRDYAERKGATGKVILFANIGVEGEGYFRATVDGVPYDAGIQHGFLRYKDKFTVSGNLTTQENLAISITKSGGYLTEGSYNYHDGILQHSLVNKAEVVYGTVGAAKAWHSSYYACSGGQKGSPGSVTIEKVEQIGSKTYVTGKFDMVVYQEEDGICPSRGVRQKRIVGEFKTAEL
ncbi:hypothetical protein GCM10028805_08880 [Spirosoma harenae]